MLPETIHRDGNDLSGPFTQNRVHRYKKEKKKPYIVVKPIKCRIVSIYYILLYVTPCFINEIMFSMMII